MGVAGSTKNSYQMASGRSYQSCVMVRPAERLLVNSITKNL